MMLKITDFFCDTITTTYKLKRQANTKNSFRKVYFKGRKRSFKFERSQSVKKESQIMEQCKSFTPPTPTKVAKMCQNRSTNDHSLLTRCENFGENFADPDQLRLTYLIKAICVIGIKDDDPHASSLFCLKFRGKSEKIAFSSDFCGFPSTGE